MRLRYADFDRKAREGRLDGGAVGWLAATCGEAAAGGAVSRLAATCGEAAAGGNVHPPRQAFSLSNFLTFTG
jgi:hypothetical protein